MTEDFDPYEEPTAPVAPGENSVTIGHDGSVTIDRKDPDERRNTWKDSKKIQATSFEAIKEYPPRERSGIVDYQIMFATPVSVSWRGTGWGDDREFLCHTHRVNDCPHTRLIRRYREEKAAFIATAQ